MQFNILQNCKARLKCSHHPSGISYLLNSFIACLPQTLLSGKLCRRHNRSVNKQNWPQLGGVECSAGAGERTVGTWEVIGVEEHTQIPGVRPSLSAQLIEANKMTKQPWVNIPLLCSGFQKLTHRNYPHP